ncbi:hypothetical protein JCM21714_144 [Gracilibacillus boraciitolerans JCM 21714]|uniref:Uncharacterized protein n=1 Tax=Gracilibacillus boraciitolerans JCM 21714 TaxID=1298598 RepID=W4VEG2_9BACI|nr:hypothetical protein [Gracilibacillus boraciitolerans]GAE91203.1 hypothetical protein JCM21714_144 [Gracilibacillus boraciitolerans JCM 21714]
MYIKNQLIQKKLVLHLMEKEEFELLSFSNTREEYLLWKKEKRKTDIVRVSLNQYDWKRDLASSVETFEKRAVQQLRLPFLQERISFHHMFICENQPVDDWEELISSSGRANKIDQSYIYIYGKDKEEIDRFYQQSNVSSSFLFSVPENLLELEYQIELLKQRITQLHKEAEKEILAMFSKGKPRYSYVLLAINILVFLFLEYAGGAPLIPKF